MRNVALIELNSYHGECLYSQLRYLKASECTVILFCDKRQESSVSEFAHLADEVCFWDMKKLSVLLRLRKILIERNVETVVFNTLHGGRVLKLMLMPFPKRMSFYGTIHNIRKMSDSFGQRLICRRVKGVYVLAEYLKPTFKKLSALPCEAYSSSLTMEKHVDSRNVKPDDVIWAVIPGSIEYKRRDYDKLLELANRTSDSVKFILLGNSRKGDGQDFISRIAPELREKRFVIFDKFVDNDTFESYITQADYLLPLITEGTPIADDYMYYKISGTFILAKTYGVPMLLHESFGRLNDFDYPAEYYTTEEELLKLMHEHHQQTDKQTDFEIERRKYVAMLFG